MCCELKRADHRYLQDTKKFENMDRGESTANELEGDLLVYQSLINFPERLDCAMLCWQALEEALPSEKSSQII